ncbi:hypothetical protein QCA50_015484 [Cerrena zonata]|uniref:Uncharacterized protein n=1 Tax=Cerrena zonata TaxID=2478898 RepID=A0AAW0FQ43_9APHY
MSYPPVSYMLHLVSAIILALPVIFYILTRLGIAMSLSFNFNFVFNFTWSSSSWLPSFRPREGHRLPDLEANNQEIRYADSVPSDFDDQFLDNKVNNRDVHDDAEDSDSEAADDDGYINTCPQCAVCRPRYRRTLNRAPVAHPPRWISPHTTTTASTRYGGYPPVQGPLAHARGSSRQVPNGLRLYEPQPLAIGVDAPAGSRPKNKAYNS